MEIVYKIKVNKGKTN